MNPCILVISGVYMVVTISMTECATRWQQYTIPSDIPGGSTFFGYRIVTMFTNLPWVLYWPEEPVSCLLVNGAFKQMFTIFEV